MSTISLRLPESLHKKARDLAKKENTSINQLVTSALAEKITAILTEEYIDERASKRKFKKALRKVADIKANELDTLTTYSILNM